MLKLLIVDDEPIIVNGLKHMITAERSLFTQVDCACDAFEALEHIERESYDLLITDIQMPEMDGLALIREAQQRQLERFVILSGYDVFDYARQAMRLGVEDYLLKPIQHRELFEVLNRQALEIMEAKKDDPGPPDVPAAAELPLISKFKAYVSEHYMYDLALEDVASHLGIHPNYFCSVLKRETGMTFVHYLNQVKIERAKELLVHPQQPTVEQVARSVGYESIRHFYKVFKQYTAHTPGSYKAAVQMTKEEQGAARNR
ncbi:response regulator transcription factor [Paenibacillus sp. 1P07SE]|uniref:response regulator transcription factor n=1 Tax=Paenibacillus sp. 1P07SE TaxID=3132209 RepID=UPI0039A4A396